MPVTPTDDHRSDTASTPPPTPPVAPPAPREPQGPRSTGADLDDLLAQIDADERGATTPSTAPSGPSSAESAAVTAATPAPRPEVESDGGLAFDPQLASFGARAVGFFIDSVVLTVLAVPGVVVAVAVNPVIGAVVVIAGFLVATVWYSRDVAASGRWIGNRAMSTQVVDVRNGRTIDRSRAAVRFVSRQLISPILLFGFLMALANSQRRTFHDQLAGTVVTRPALERWELDDETMAAGSGSRTDR